MLSRHSLHSNDSLLVCKPCVGTGKMSFQMALLFQKP